MSHEIRAKSTLLPTIPITSPQFVYRRASETDVGATFARARAAMELPSNRGERVETLASGLVDTSTPRTTVANVLGPAPVG
ncbi:MAG: hypothetical protein WCE38_25690 [Burkholderiales bacterium]